MVEDDLDIASELATYGGRYDHLFEEIRSDLNELRATGFMSRARNLGAAIGDPDAFASDDYPHFFFGELDSPFVLIHLNPRYDRSPPALYQGDAAPCSFEEHFSRHRHYGALHYGPTSPRTFRSAFDEKQIDFIRPFDVIRFTNDRFINLERVVDSKLQIELVPYGSPDWPRGFTANLLTPYFDRVMRVIGAAPRDYVIFCGADVRKVLHRSWMVNEHLFYVTKSDGTQTRQRLRFINLRIPWRGQVLEAGLASSFARQGLRGKPMEAYGRECSRLYRAS